MTISDLSPLDRMVLVVSTGGLWHMRNPEDRGDVLADCPACRSSLVRLRDRDGGVLVEPLCECSPRRVVAAVREHLGRVEA